MNSRNHLALMRMNRIRMESRLLRRTRPRAWYCCDRAIRPMTGYRAVGTVVEMISLACQRRVCSPDFVLVDSRITEARSVFLAASSPACTAPELCPMMTRGRPCPEPSLLVVVRSQSSADWASAISSKNRLRNSHREMDRRRACRTAMRPTRSLRADQPRCH